MAELERLHSHVLWAGIAAKLMGFKTMFMTCFEIREKVMDVLAGDLRQPRELLDEPHWRRQSRHRRSAAVLKMVEQLEARWPAPSSPSSPPAPRHVRAARALAS
jgi:hypothetical protein